MVTQTSSCGLVDKIWGYHEVDPAFDSSAQPVFSYFSTRKDFSIQFKFPDFLRSLDLYGLEKNFTEIFTYQGGDVCPPHA